jgi:DNA-directed RNA polymerase sigma subunit (sigma70/sigma32)
LSRAQQRLVERNLRLVPFVVKRHWGGFPAPALEELTAAGHLALCRAARNFDPTRGVKESTHLTKSLKLALTAYVQGMDRWGVGSGKREDARVVRKARRECVAAGVEATDEEIARRADGRLSAERVRTIRTWMDAQNAVSLDAPAGDSERALGEIVGARGFEGDLVESLAQRELLESLRGRINVSARDWEIFKAVALGGELKQQGELHGITRQRAQQIYQGVLQRLRNAARSPSNWEALHA